MRQEELTASRDMEVGRHNLVQEGLQRQSLDETARANKAREQETERANRAQEGLTAARDAETGRANRAREGLQRESNLETARANRAREQLQSDTLSETIRSNQANEGMRSREIDLKTRAQTEVERSNRARESETSRANRAREQETYRSNVAKEMETNRSNLAREIELNRSNVAKEDELHRHNSTTEKIDIGRAATYAADVAGRLIYYAKDHGTKINVGGSVATALPGKPGSGGSLGVPSGPINNGGSPVGGVSTPNNYTTSNRGGNTNVEVQRQGSTLEWFYQKNQEQSQQRKGSFGTRGVGRGSFEK